MDQGDHDLSTLKKQDQGRAPLTEALNKFLDRRPVYFCIPGHRFDTGIPDSFMKSCGGNIVNFDVTEAPGLDDLHNARGAIREAQELLAEAYGSRYSRFLVNGTTCGIEAAVLACVSPGEKILLPRNAHRSVLSGLVMSGAVPVWVSPETDPEFGFPLPVSPEKIREALQSDHKIRAVLAVSPTYYGTYCDLKTISDICHSYGAAFIVDEAHGAHLYFDEAQKPFCALTCGADISVMSAHKTLGAFGQSSYLHLNGSLVSVAKIDRALKMLMSSSPSYMLMASLDSARREAVLQGREQLAEAACIAGRIREGAQMAGFSVYDGEAHDPARVVISADGTGLSGTALSGILFEQYNIAVEMSDLKNIVLVVTHANTGEDAQMLVSALGKIRREYAAAQTPGPGTKQELYAVPEAVLTPREAYFAPKKAVSLEEAAGCTAGEEIVVYPPGSALLYPGERIDEKLIRTIRSCMDQGLTLQRGSGIAEDQITVVFQS